VLDVLHQPVLARERALHRHEVRLRVAHVGQEEQARVEVALPVAAVDEVVAATQDPHPAEVLRRRQPDVRVGRDGLVREVRLVELLR
jgi:hypothetical protein